jgi:hypothetical protein
MPCTSCSAQTASRPRYLLHVRLLVALAFRTVLGGPWLQPQCIFRFKNIYLLYLLIDISLVSSHYVEQDMGSAVTGDCVSSLCEARKA